MKKESLDDYKHEIRFLKKLKQEFGVIIPLTVEAAKKLETLFGEFSDYFTDFFNIPDCDNCDERRGEPVPWHELD